jgi:hypothetical protein
LTMDAGCIDLLPMTTVRPEKLGSRFVEFNEERRTSMPALIELARAVLGDGRPFRFRANGGNMTPFIQDWDRIALAPVLVASSGD